MDRFPRFLDQPDTDTVEVATGGAASQAALSQATASSSALGMQSAQQPVQVQNYLDVAPPEIVAAMISIILCEGCQVSSQEWTIVYTF